MHGNALGCGHAHSQICRDRIKNELSRTEDGRARLQAFDDRKKRSEEKNKDGSKAMEARAAEELLREGLPEGVRVQGGEDDPGRTPKMADTEDEAMEEKGDVNESGEMDDEEDMDEDKGEDSDMTLLRSAAGEGKPDDSGPV